MSVNQLKIYLLLLSLTLVLRVVPGAPMGTVTPLKEGLHCEATYRMAIFKAAKKISLNTQKQSVKSQSWLLTSSRRIKEEANGPYGMDDGDNRCSKHCVHAHFR